MPHPESKMRASVLAALRKNGFHAEAVDNESCSPGTPDITYCGLDISTQVMEGWLELKQLPWPKQDETVVPAAHFTLKQKVWIRKRWNAGGCVGVLLKVHNAQRTMWALIAGPYVDIIGQVPVEKLWRASSDAIYSKTLSAEWLHRALGDMHGVRKQEISSD